MLFKNPSELIRERAQALAASLAQSGTGRRYREERPTKSDQRQEGSPDAGAGGEQHCDGEETISDLLNLRD
jgi:hypothetical protein